MSSTPRSLSNTTSPAVGTPGSASPIVTTGTRPAMSAQSPLGGPIGETMMPSTRWSTSRRASSSSIPGVPSASATSVCRSAARSSRWIARESSCVKKSDRLPTSSATIPVEPPRRARAIGSASYPISAAACCTRACVAAETWIPRSAYETAEGDRPVLSASSRIVARLGRVGTAAAG